jgi:hypothetical protein
MNIDVNLAPRLAKPAVAVQHIIKGELVEGDATVYGSGPQSFTTPRIDIDTLTWSRLAPGPAFDVPLKEILDVLAATGERLRADPDGYVAEALDRMAQTCTLERRIVANLYHDLPAMFLDRAGLEYRLKRELGSLEILDGWVPERLANGYELRVRAFPPRMLHVLAGNVPAVAAGTIIQGALTKGVHLLKMPSNDLFTAPAILKTMAAAAPNHPVLRSFSAVYWRGGDAEIEGRICHPQFFDKIAAWGGEGAIRGIKKYTGPGLELITFDPKTSLSFIGRETFESEQTVTQAAELGAIDATWFDQSACISSRFQFVEGSIEQADQYCQQLHACLLKERRYTAAACFRVPTDIREEIEGLKMMESEFRVWGKYDGSGIVIRSDDPVEFQPDGKIVNVVRVDSIRDAVKYASVATSTAGVYPFALKTKLRDPLASAGAQRIVDLGLAMMAGNGAPHDGFWSMNRFMKWISEEGPAQA